MDINGRYIQIDKFGNPDHYIEIEDRYISFFHRELKADSFSLIKAPFMLKEAKNILSTENYDIDVTVTDIPKPDFVCHIEKIEDKEITIISSMTFEADGRGRIVIGTYVREQDLDSIPTDFESRLKKVCNNRPASPMKQMLQSLGDISLMQMGMMQLTNVIPKSDITKWDCACGQKENPGRFCINCGAMVPQK